MAHVVGIEYFQTLGRINNEIGELRMSCMNSDDLSVAKELFERFNQGEELDPSEVEFLLNALSATELGHGVENAVMVALLKLKSASLLIALNEAADPVEAFGDDAQDCVGYLVTAYVQGWISEEADVSLVKEYFDLKIEGLISAIDSGEELDELDQYFLRGALSGKKLKEGDAQVVADALHVPVHEPSIDGDVLAPVHPRIEARTAGPVPLNFSIESFDVDIGYIKDGSSFKEASIYKNGRHQISVKIAIKLNRFDNMGDPVVVDNDHLVNSLYLCYYGNGVQLPEKHQANNVFYKREMNRFCWLLEPKGMVSKLSPASNWYVDVLPDDTIVTEFYVSVDGRLAPESMVISAGLKTDKGVFTTAKNSTDTLMANGSTWTGKSNVTLHTLEAIDYAKAESVKLESKHQKNAHMWKGYSDFEEIANNLYTSCHSIGGWLPCFGSSDDKGYSYHAEVEIAPAIAHGQFKLKKVLNRRRDYIPYVDYNNHDLPDSLFFRFASGSIDTAFLFIEQETYGVTGGEMGFTWGMCEYWSKLKYPDSANFAKDHVFSRPLDKGKVRIGLLDFYLGKGGLDPKWMSGRVEGLEQYVTHDVEVYDELGNYGIIRISSRSSEWPSVRINGHIF